MQSNKIIKRVSLFLFFLLVLNGLPLLAAGGGDLTGALSDVTSEIRSATGNIIQIVFIIGGVACALGFIYFGWKFFKGDHDASDSAIKWFVGVVLFLLMTIVIDRVFHVGRI